MRTSRHGYDAFTRLRLSTPRVYSIRIAPTGGQCQRTRTAWLAVRARRRLTRGGTGR